jgi:hypothetical protein
MGKSIGWSVALACAMLFGCASTRSGPPNVDVTGEWVGQWTNAGNSGGMTMTLKQVDGAVTGDVIVLPATMQMSGPAHGSVEGNVLSISYRGSGADLTVRGDEMTGKSRLGSTLSFRRK